MDRRKLNEMGEGLCSVPMWMGGCPAGHCDKPAYGEQTKSPMVYHAPQQRMVRADMKYDGYAPGLACPMHAGPTTRTYKDGNAWCAVKPDFVNLQESVAGFGETKEEAVKQLALCS